MVDEEEPPPANPSQAAETLVVQDTPAAATAQTSRASRPRRGHHGSPALRRGADPVSGPLHFPVHTHSGFRDLVIAWVFVLIFALIFASVLFYFLLFSFSPRFCHLYRHMPSLRRRWWNPFCDCETSMREGMPWRRTETNGDERKRTETPWRRHGDMQTNSMNRNDRTF